MVESTQQNMEELFSLSANELQRHLDKLEAGNHSLFQWQNEETPRFVEKVIFQPKKCNVHFPAISPNAFSRGIRSTSSLPDGIDAISNTSESSPSSVIPLDKKPKLHKNVHRFASPSPPRVREKTVDKKEPLFCQGKAFLKTKSAKETLPNVAIDSVGAVNSSSKESLPRIHDNNPTQVGPCFRAWSSQKRERITENESTHSKDLDFHLDAIEQKAVRSFDVYGLLKEVRRLQEPRSQTSMDEISIKSAASYVTKMNLSARGGGFTNRTKHISVRDEIIIKKMLRQKLFSFYDFGGSTNAFERLVSDVSGKNPYVKFKNLPAYPDNEDIFPLAAPHSNLPMLPNTPTHLEKLYKLLDTFPWFSWQQGRPLQTEIVQGLQHTKPEISHNSRRTMSDSQVDFSNSRLEVRLPSCMA